MKGREIILKLKLDCSRSQEWLPAYLKNKVRGADRKIIKRHLENCSYCSSCLLVLEKMAKVEARFESEKKFELKFVHFRLECESCRKLLPAYLKKKMEIKVAVPTMLKIEDRFIVTRKVKIEILKGLVWRHLTTCSSCFDYFADLAEKMINSGEIPLVFFESSLKKLKKEKKVIPLKYWRLKRKIFG